MITLLPFANFAETAACLDRQRLGKQRTEVLTIARCLAGQPSSWKKHPAVTMWAPYQAALLRYQDALCYEWAEIRGYNDTALAATFTVLKTELSAIVVAKDPWWVDDPDFNQSHRSQLVTQDPEHYRQFFPGVPTGLSLLWPGDEEGTWQ